MHRFTVAVLQELHINLFDKLELTTTFLSLFGSEAWIFWFGGSQRPWHVHGISRELYVFILKLNQELASSLLWSKAVVGAPIVSAAVQTVSETI